MISLSRFTWIIIIICCCFTIIGLILITFKKFTSRGPVYPIPIPNISKLSPKVLEAQPISSISRNVIEYDEKPFKYFNNKKYNENLINFTGSIFLFIIIVVFVLTTSWYGHTSNNDVFFYWYTTFFCLNLFLPTLYFILNPRHLLWCPYYASRLY